MIKLEDIILRTVEKDKLYNLLDIILPENQKLHIDAFAVYKDVYVVDADCCFWDIPKQHFAGKIQPVLVIECRIKKYDSEGRYSIRMDKFDFIKIVQLSDYLSISQEIKMTDFIRFNYNPRIEGNQRLFLEYIKELEQ
jgi:hypothetical protein